MDKEALTSLDSRAQAAEARLAALESLHAGETGVCLGAEVTLKKLRSALLRV